LSDPIYAHSANKLGRWHPLKDHLSAVAKLAEAHFDGDAQGKRPRPTWAKA